MSNSSNSDLNISDDSEQSLGAYGVVYGNDHSYANEPVTRGNPDDEEQGRIRNEVDYADGLTPEVVAADFSYIPKNLHYMITYYYTYT